MYSTVFIALIQQVGCRHKKSLCGRKRASDSQVSLGKSAYLPFSFRSQVEFNATQNLFRSRSESFLESKRSRDKIIREEEMKEEDHHGTLNLLFSHFNSTNQSHRKETVDMPCYRVITKMNGIKLRRRKGDSG